MSNDMNGKTDEGGDEAQYEATKNAVEDTYERDGGHLFADGVLCGELNKGLYSRLEQFEKEIKLARDDGNRQFELESIEAYIRTARKLDGVDVPVDTSDGEPVLMTDGGEDETPNIVEYIPADKNPDGEAVKRFVHLRNGSWDIRAHRYLDNDPNAYRAECSECGTSFPTFGRAEAHVKTCGEDEPVLMTDGGVDETYVSNGGESNYVGIQNADDAQHVEPGDTVSVEINAYPECDDRESAFRKGGLTDSYEATVTDVAENRPVHGIKWSRKLTLDNGDELSICSDGARELERDNEWYTSYDTYCPENEVSIAVVADDGVRLTVEGGEVVSDETLDRIEDIVSEMGRAGSLIQYDLRDSKKGNDGIREQANTIVGASNRFDQLIRDLRNSGETDE